MHTVPCGQKQHERVSNDFRVMRYMFLFLDVTVIGAIHLFKDTDGLTCDPSGKDVLCSLRADVIDL